MIMAFDSCVGFLFLVYLGFRLFLGCFFSVINVEAHTAHCRMANIVMAMKNELSIFPCAPNVYNYVYMQSVPSFFAP